MLHPFVGGLGLGGGRIGIHILKKENQSISLMRERERVLHAIRKVLSSFTLTMLEGHVESLTGDMLFTGY